MPLPLGAPRPSPRRRPEAAPPGCSRRSRALRARGPWSPMPVPGQPARARDPGAQTARHQVAFQGCAPHGAPSSWRRGVRGSRVPWLAGLAGPAAAHTLTFLALRHRGRHHRAAPQQGQAGADRPVLHAAASLALRPVPGARLPHARSPPASVPRSRRPRARAQLLSLLPRVLNGSWVRSRSCSFMPA